MHPNIAPRHIETVVAIAAPVSPRVGINKKFRVLVTNKVTTPKSREIPGLPLAEIIVVMT